MHKTRLEAFSDGVIAIIITIMVLELKVPHGTTLSDLYSLKEVFFSYVLSFIYIAIYWNNHHHLLHTVKVVNGKILWANIHLLFWLSLVPFVTSWSGENHFSNIPVALYGIILFMSAIAYYILSKTIIANHGKDSILAKAVGKDIIGIISLILYGISIPTAIFNPIISLSIYALVALIWLIPDSRIEKTISQTK
jgi:uncharacterized membrane protein